MNVSRDWALQQHAAIIKNSNHPLCGTELYEVYSFDRLARLRELEAASKPLSLALHEHIAISARACVLNHLLFSASPFDRQIKYRKSLLASQRRFLLHIVQGISRYLSASLLFFVVLPHHIYQGLLAMRKIGPIRLLGRLRLSSLSPYCLSRLLTRYWQGCRVELACGLKELEDGRSCLVRAIGEVVSDEAGGTKGGLSLQNAAKVIARHVDEKEFSRLQPVPLAELIQESVDELMAQYRAFKPSWITRRWLPATAVASTVWISYQRLRTIDPKLVQRIAMDGWVAVNNLWSHWIWKPFCEIWHTIRYKDNSLVVGSISTLQADYESLERMVSDFIVEKGHEVGPSVATDMSIILKEYEVGIKSPVQSILTGTFYKSKVDLEAAMIALDKLLKSNQLNFEILAIIPVLLIAYYSLKWIRYKYTDLFDRSAKRTRAKVQRSLHTIHSILNRTPPLSKADTSDVGELFIELHHLATLSSAGLGNKSTMDAFIEDLRPLMISDYSPEQKRASVVQIQQYYEFLRADSK